jgi:hypothetical protein
VFATKCLEIGSIDNIMLCGALRIPFEHQKNIHKLGIIQGLKLGKLFSNRIQLFLPTTKHKIFFPKLNLTII